jgi:hypothetical protein
MKALGDFCSKMGDLVTSLAGTSKDREKAWKNVKATTSKLGTEIKKAVTTPSKVNVRATSL